MIEHLAPWATIVLTAILTAGVSAIINNTLGHSVLRKMDEGEAKRDAARREQAEAEAQRREEHKELIDRLDALEDADRSLLRAEIIRLHRRGMRDESVTLEDREYMDRTYKSYKRLKGNDIGTRLYNEFMALPTVEEAAQ